MVFKLTYYYSKKVGLLFYYQIDSKYFYQLIVIYERGFLKYQWNIDTAEKKWGTDSTSELQEHKGFTQSLKLWLNLCSFQAAEPKP